MINYAPLTDPKIQSDNPKSRRPTNNKVETNDHENNEIKNYYPTHRTTPANNTGKNLHQILPWHTKYTDAN
ncbi:hypothetical protein BVRB_4g085110 [Beta vulgaris subsp. vulgaris]|nr:hypothetical protein BVRB_4g085110 [Beta vulgaris subsp. vulgaris]